MVPSPILVLLRMHQVLHLVHKLYCMISTLLLLLLQLYQLLESLGVELKHLHQSLRDHLQLEFQLLVQTK